MKVWRTVTHGLVVLGCLAVAACEENPPPADRGVDARDAGPDVTVDGATCSLKIATINGRPVATVSSLSGSDDQDTAAPGIQADIEVTGTNVPDGTDVILNVTELGDLTAKASGGRALFSAVSLGVDLTQVVLHASGGGCSGDRVDLPVQSPPECIFAAPTDGEGLGKADDKNPATAALDYDVSILAKNAKGGQVVLSINGAAQPPEQPDSYDKVLYADMILPEGTVQLKAEVSVGSVKRSCTASVEVATGAPKCNFLGFNPAPFAMSDGGQGLGTKQDADPATPGIQTNIEVQSEAGNNVNLVVDGLVYKTVVSNGGVANFDKVPLEDGQRTLYATCVHPKTSASTQSQSASVLVDSAAPLAVDDFTCMVVNNRQGKINCSWTSKGDNAGGSGVESVRIRYQPDTPLTAASWDGATVLGEVPPGTPGVWRSEQYGGLTLGHTYNVGLRTVDRVGNESDLAAAAGLLLDFKKQERSLGSISDAMGVGGAIATGDFNCDGLTDVAVGAPDVAGGMGKVYIFLGTANGLLASPEKILSGTVAQGHFGWGLAALPNFDADGDNCHDLAVLGSGSTSVYVYLGRKFFFDRTDVQPGTGADLIFQPTSGQLFGAAASAGDFDGDGATDLAVSIIGPSGSTSVLVVYGMKGLSLMAGTASPLVKELPAAAGVQIGPGQTSDSFGFLGEGAKIDADAYADLLIGAKDVKISGTARGAAYVVRGGLRASTLPEVIALDSSRVQTITGGAGNAAFGTSVGFVGDMNKDGKREFAVGDPQASGGLGAVYLFNLESNPTTAADAVATVANDLSSGSADGLGLFIAGAGNIDPLLGGDLNADTYADLVASAKGSAVGAVFQIPGALGALANLGVSKASYVWPGAGQRVIFARDLNGDGYLDVVIGDPAANGGKGRFFVYY